MNRKICTVGVNYTTSRQFSLIKDLIDENVVDFVEILIDNFLTVPAQSILQKFDGMPIAFHIMNSRFLETDEKKLRELSVPLKALIRDIKPLYVSDHVGNFTHNGCLLPVLGEYDYSRIEHAIDSVSRWQDFLGTQLLLENFPSYTIDGIDQPDFFRTVLSATQAGLLFDVSNAVIAAHNAKVPLSAWDDLVSASCHFHAGGYSESEHEPSMLLDTHDRELGVLTDAAIASILSRHRSDTATITVEFDRNIHKETWKGELVKIAGLNVRSRVADFAC
jgi:uncharacterized protein